MTEFVISLGIVTASHFIGLGVCKWYYGDKERKSYLRNLVKQNKN